MQRFLSTLPYSTTVRQLGSIACAALLLAACNSGGDGGGGTTPAAAPIMGTFIDSPVNGLHFISPPSNPAGGVTSGGGQFPCQPGDNVTFDVGGKVIGTPQPCSSNAVTAVSVLGATSATDPSVVNLSQLLLTLGPVVNNVIQIPQPLPAGFNGSLVPAFNDPNFDTAVVPALPAGTPLVSNAAAAAQLATSFKTLSVTIVNGGIVTSTPPGINCTAAGTCSYSFVAGTAVTLTATGSGFVGWSGGTGSASCTGTGMCSVTVNLDSGVTATFPVAPPPATLTISKAGNGTGTVNCSVNQGAFGACAASYPNGTALSLQGVAGNGSTFTGWSNGTGSIGCSGTSNCPVTLTADSAVTATFTLIGTQVLMTANTATTTGGAGTVACSTIGQNGPFVQCAPSYNAGTTLWLQATPNTVSNFTGWTGLTGSAACQALTSPFCTFTLNIDSTITANFNRPTVSVNVIGPGTVTSTPAGINCPGTCAATFNANSSVVLSTSSAGFSGWSVGKGSANCSGTGTCTIPTPPSPLPLVDSSITASFSQGGTTSSRWLFYGDGATTIRYADPANPGATTTALTTSAAAPDLMLVPTWDSTNAAYTNLTAPYVTFFSGGKVWRVSAMKSSGVPGSAGNPPVQISSETTAVPPVCDENEVAHTTATSIKLFYELPGADGICATQNDNVTKWVTVSDNATTPPSALAPGLVLTGVNSSGNGVPWVTDLSTGLPSHVFLLDAANNNTLKLLNLSTNVSSTIQANVGKVRILVQDTSNRVFLRGGANDNTLYLYTVTNNSLVPLVTGASQLRHGTPMGDGTNFYLAEQANGKLYKVPMNATGPSDVVTLLTSVGFPLLGSDDIVVTTNNVFLHTYVPCSGGCTPPDPLLDAHGLYRVSKSGGSATPIIAHATGTNIDNILAAKDLLYYNHQLPPGIPQANIINENGTSVFASPTSCFPCSGWTGVIGSPTFFVRSNDIPLSKVLLSALANSTGNAATLTAFDAPTGTQGANLGIVPTTTPTLEPGLRGGDFLDTVTLLVGVQNGSANNFLFFVDSVLPGSLTQVPTGTAGPWFPVGSFN